VVNLERGKNGAKCPFIIMTTKAYLMVGNRFEVDGSTDEEALNNLNNMLSSYKLVIPEKTFLRALGYTVRRIADKSNTARYSVAPTYGDEDLNDVCIGKVIDNDGSGVARATEEDIIKAFAEVREDIPDCEVLVFHDSYRERK
jgi:hypothetical protein